MIKDRFFLIFLALFFLLLEGCAGQDPKSDDLTVLEEPCSYEHIISHYSLQPGDIIDFGSVSHTSYTENPKKLNNPRNHKA